MKKLLLVFLGLTAIACGSLTVFEEDNLADVETLAIQTTIADTALKVAPGGVTYKVLTTLKQTWQWDLSDNPNTNTLVQVFDVDAFTTPVAKVAALKARGTYTVGYFDTSYEPFRADAAALEPYKCGKYAGWPGQFWVDIRKPEVKTIMFARLDAVKAKGFDAVEADSVDVVGNTNGCLPKLTAADNIKFIKDLSDYSRNIGLAFFLKNSNDLMYGLNNYYDGVIIEECAVYSECASYRNAAPTIPMFETEYVQSGNVVTRTGTITAAAKRLLTRHCASSNNLSLNMIVKKYDLDAQRAACN